MRFALIALLMTAPLSLSAVAPEIKSTTRITVSAGNLSDVIEITDEATLALSHVFSGTFLSQLAPAPDSMLPRYTLTFDIQTLQGVKEAAYVVLYCVDEATGQGFVYLPGPGEEAFRCNISTILRKGHDGYWHRASDEWSAVISRYVAR
jgi:hypothetical protein